MLNGEWTVPARMGPSSRRVAGRVEEKAPSCGGRRPRERSAAGPRLAGTGSATPVPARVLARGCPHSASPRRPRASRRGDCAACPRRLSRVTQAVKSAQRIAPPPAAEHAVRRCARDVSRPCRRRQRRPADCCLLESATDWCHRYARWSALDVTGCAHLSGGGSEWAGLAASRLACDG